VKLLCGCLLHGGSGNHKSRWNRIRGFLLKKKKNGRSFLLFVAALFGTTTNTAFVFRPVEFSVVGLIVVSD
jgi:hypothetical protein